MIGMPGNGSVRELTGTGAAIATRRWAVLDEITAFNNNKKPFTVIANQMGQNDTAATYTQFFNTNYRSLITRLRARYPGVKIVALPPLGRTVSTRTVTLTSVGTVVTATIASGINGLTTGQTVSISGATQTEYNGNVVITVTGPNSFTYNFAGSATSPATGTITANDLYLRASYQSFSANNTWPADGTDASGKWRLRADILAKTSACCDDAIDTYAAWVSGERDGVWPGMLELSSTVVTVQSGTDGVATYTTIEVADASVFGPEQEISTYAGPDGLARLSTTSIGSISGNTITISIPRSTVLPVGSIVRLSVTPDGVHPYGAVIDRVATGIPQSEKVKFNP